MAKDAGMKYVVITTKHHDGFDLFDSKVSNTPPRSHPVWARYHEELSTAVRGEGLTMCWYHSIMDWQTRITYLPSLELTRAVRRLSTSTTNTTIPVSELLTNYGPIA